MSHPLFITVPETTLPNGAVVPAFQVGQFLCSKGEDGKATVSATAKPWVRINFADAKKACEDAGFKLITELQCLAIAHNIAQQDVNWSGCKVGEGSLFMGLHRWTVNEAQAGDFVSPNENERRMFALSNGELICDAAGNAYTWVFDDVQGDEHGVVARPFAEDSPSIMTAPFPSMQNGVGWYPNAGDDWSGGALLRGSCWNSYDDAGVFFLVGDWPGNGGDDISFRCTKPVGL